MGYMNSTKYWSEGSEWQLYAVTGRYTETKDTHEISEYLNMAWQVFKNI